MHFQGRVTPTRPYKWIFRDGQGGDPPLKMDLQGQVGGGGFTHPYKSFSRGGDPYPPLQMHIQGRVDPPLEIDLQGRVTLPTAPKNRLNQKI